ncbi:LuxR C-terminal-related transcriptional regulator [Brachybacterium sp. J144]|uniref:helix-turn-helix transcriptional regulator n=1 Tax=Brachybacterium sp. J144 TaxID=3116487 RepID=UPI002E7A9A5E|nr:LuxR C-terminal-related transcriptional regulator [Brachybacterium sp. J144]MEE1649356.1 LuxR C-terminal-related transcriptional regulator [Brachybacterium sp. J144]
MSDLPTPLERARSLSRDRALTEQADQHAITLESILAVLRSGRLADAAARREATEIASSALIRARSVHEQQESVLEPVAEAFSRLRTELRPLIRSGPLQVQFAEPPARGRALPGPVAREARAISRTAVLSLMDRADAARARIGWDCDGRNLLMEVRDDGGTAVTAHDDTLRPIVERVAALDGTMDVETTPGWGTTLRIEIPLDPPSAALTVEGAEELTDREKQVLRLVATGISNQRIGDQLGITANTVKYHVANLLRKYGARTRAELASIAHSHDAHSPSAETR